ncbi:MAG: histidine phosphatase family protein [Proteobacteria bacterium]|nr:MAG: histidine phosphatase family protein [Pseudomonadota bacterium]
MVKSDSIALSKWPRLLYVVRHGQSAGNVARDYAELNRLETVDINVRDMDVPLSELGHSQAQSLGEWMSGLSETDRPTRILSSSYLRARQTAEGARSFEPAYELPPIIIDERLREREFGLIDHLTKFGITAKFPLEAASYAKLGKFYYRPPGGESWCDVILRLRSVLDSLSRDHAGEVVLIVCHTVVVHCLRYLFEELTEAEILAIDRSNEIANCSISSFRGTSDEIRGERLVLESFNDVKHLKNAGEKVTRATDCPTPT